jgi:GNAT superfamily N-acetyltransferase
VELTVHIVEAGGEGPLLGLVHDRLLRPNFHPDEMTAPDDLRAAVLAGRCVVSAVVDDRDGPVAAAVGHWDGAHRVLLLSYLAVHPGHRSGGLGSLLMKEVGGSWQDRFHPVVTLAEVEHPLAHPARPDHGDPVARLRFYGRHGARALDLPYFQPALRPGADRVHGMLLLALAPLPAGPSPCALAAAPVEGFLTRYLRSSEGRVGADREAADLLRAVRRPGGIPLLPLDDPAALPLSTAG